MNKIIYRNPNWHSFCMLKGSVNDIPAIHGQVLFLVEIIEAGVFNQQQARLASVYRVSSACAVRA